MIKEPLQRIKDRLILNKKTGCLEYSGCLGTDGYGRLSVNSTTCLAHRSTWILTFGEIEDGLCVLHKCDNRKCCNIEHLFLGTYKDNYHDMVKKGRHLKGKDHHCYGRRGEKHPAHKLYKEWVAK